MKTAWQVVESWMQREDRAVLFDFNGTLSDDEPMLLRIYTEMFLEYVGWTLTPRHYYSQLAGRSDREIIDLLVEELGDEHGRRAALLDVRRRRYQELVSVASPVDAGTVALVEALNAMSVALGIVTGAERADVEYVLGRAGLEDCFAVVVAAEDVSVGKPDPACFHLAAQRLGVTPADVLVFEDSLHGLAAARAAGMTCIAVAGTQPPAELEMHADGVVDRLDLALLRTR